MNWNDKIGSKVIFTGSLKMLDKGMIGFLTGISGSLGFINYPQNACFEQDKNGDYVPIKGKSPKVYAHSAKLTEIILL